ncbi:MAG: hypothetical protein P1S60_18935, partial [Anaerolineae bacterium]|nr:hypothetical protein [Anaerolineae bacterium]
SKQWGIRELFTQFKDLVAITVPAIVLTTRRAWSITEAASARGFDAPHRNPYHQLTMQWLDWSLMVGTGVILSLVAFINV